MQNLPLEGSCVIVALIKNYSTSKLLKVSPEKSHFLSCDTVVANGRYVYKNTTQNNVLLLFYDCCICIQMNQIQIQIYIYIYIYIWIFAFVYCVTYEFKKSSSFSLCPWTGDYGNNEDMTDGSIMTQYSNAHYPVYCSHFRTINWMTSIIFTE